MLTRQDALDILFEFTKGESLRKHALAVETCVTAYARRFGEDETKWSVTALLHDFDYEMYPNVPDHPMKVNIEKVTQSSLPRHSPALSENSRQLVEMFMKEVNHDNTSCCRQVFCREGC